MPDDLRLGPGASSTHMEVFAARYNQLFIIARSLTYNDQDQARDLVHDAMIKFVRLKPGLHMINNIDSYLRALLRNLFKSQMRRANVHSTSELIVENYDLVESRLPKVADRYCNPDHLLQLQDMLRVICEYACFRKEMLKLGSALIMRFFHGYHTSEIAQIMGVTASAVSHQLKLAQAEAYLYLNDPKRLNLSHEIAGIRIRFGLNYGCLVDDLVDELRRAIFQSSLPCKFILQFRLHKIYGRQRKQKAGCETLAHIVSCVGRLDTINDFMGFESLSMRYPIDTLSRRTKAWKVYGSRGEETITQRTTQPPIQIAYCD